MCDHDKVRQENGDRVCVVATCPDSATADLITSCCLVEPAKDDETGGTVCSQCGTPTDRPDPLTPEETATVVRILRSMAKLDQTLADYPIKHPGAPDAAEFHAKAKRYAAKAKKLGAIADKLEA